MVAYFFCTTPYIQAWFTAHVLKTWSFMLSSWFRLFIRSGFRSWHATPHRSHCVAPAQNRPLRHPHPSATVWRCAFRNETFFGRYRLRWALSGKLQTIHHHLHHHRTKRLWWRAVRRLRGHHTKFRKSFESAWDGTQNQKLSDTADTIVQDSFWRTVQSSGSS